MHDVTAVDGSPRQVALSMTDYQPFPDLSVGEYRALKADIAKRGIQVPIEVDDDGNILDGHQRVRAWEELRAAGSGIPDYPRIVRSGLSEDQKQEHALVLNLRRRNLTPAQRQEATVILRERGWSVNRIATAEKVNEKTVRRDLVSSGHVSTPDRVIGADGKSYPQPANPITSPRREVMTAHNTNEPIVRAPVFKAPVGGFTPVPKAVPMTTTRATFGASGTEAGHVDGEQETPPASPFDLASSVALETLIETVLAESPRALAGEVPEEHARLALDQAIRLGRWVTEYSSALQERMAIGHHARGNGR